MQQRPFEYLAVAAHVVVAPRDDAHGRALGPAGQGLFEGSAGEGASGFSDDALGLVQVEHLGAHRPLGHGNHLVHQIPHDGEGDVAHSPHRGSVDEGVHVLEVHRSAPGQRGSHAGRPGRLGADQACAGVMLPEPQGDPGGQTPSANWNDDRVDRTLALLGQLDAHRALAHDGPGVVERVNVDGAGAGSIGEGGDAGLVVRAADDDHLDPVSTDGGNSLTLLARGIRREEDPTPDA